MDIFVFVESLKSSKRSKRLLLISVEKQFLQKWRQFFASNELKQLFDSESVYASDFGLAIWRSNAFSEKNYACDSVTILGYFRKVMETNFIAKVG